MGGTCLAPLTMVTRDLSECGGRVGGGGQKGGRAGLRGQVFILICVHRLLALAAAANTWRAPCVGITSGLPGLTV